MRLESIEETLPKILQQLVASKEGAAPETKLALDRGQVSGHCLQVSLLLVVPSLLPCPADLSAQPDCLPS